MTENPETYRIFFMMKNPKITYYENMLEDEFSTAKITAKSIDASYDYEGGIPRKLGRILLYGILARILAFPYLKLRFGHRVRGREKLKGFGKNGFYLYGNHTQAIADALIPSMLCFPRFASVIVHANNVSMPFLGRLTPCLGAIPLPDDKAAYRSFAAAVEKRLSEGECVTIYPEAHIWPYYIGIRPFPESSFRYPAKDHRPVFCFTNTYRRRPLLGTVQIITYVDGPFYAPENVAAARRKQALRQQAYEAMTLRSKESTFEKIRYLPKGEEPETTR